VLKDRGDQGRQAINPAEANRACVLETGRIALTGKAEDLARDQRVRDT